MKKKIFAVLALCLLTSAAVFAEENGASDAASVTGIASGLRYIAAALAVAFACIGGGMAVGKIGAAAMGAMSGGKILGLPGAAVGAIAGGVLGIIQNWNLFNESVEATAARLKEASTNANNTYIQKKADYQFELCKIT